MANKRITIVKVIPYIFVFVTLIVFILYIANNANKYRQLLVLSSESLVILVVLAILSLLWSGTINYYLYPKIGVELPFRESFGLASVNTLANQLPFAGGLVAKGIFLKKKHDLKYTHYLSATGALFVCFLAINGLMGLLSLFLVWGTEGKNIPLILITGFGLMCLSLGLLWVPINFQIFPKNWRHHLLNLSEGWQVLCNNRGLLLRLSTIQVLSVLTMAGRFWIAFHVFSQQVTFAQSILFSSATILTRLLSISPGGLGIREGIIAGVGSLMGFDPGVSAVAVGFDRLISTTVVIILGFYFTYVFGLKVFETEM